ncbi:MAG: ATPase, partial [Hoylesella buccalis]
MYLIADSGSTKTDWAVIEDNQLGKVITTKGM